MGKYLVEALPHAFLCYKMLFTPIRMRFGVSEVLFYGFTWAEGDRLPTLSVIDPKKLHNRE